MLLGKPTVVGVAGSTLTEWCGLRLACRADFETDVETELLEEVELALLWEWWWVWCIERIEETDEEVDFLPRRPAVPDARRIVERGVSGDGDRDCLL